MQKNKFLMVFSLLCVFILSAEVAASDDTTIAHFIHTGAINGAIEPPEGKGGWAVIKGYVNSLRKRGETVFLFDCGDAHWGSGPALVSGGEITATLANAAGYDAMLLGNLDLNATSLDLLKMPLIAGNSDFYKTYPRVRNSVPYAIITKDGITVGVIGVLYGPDDTQDAYLEHQEIVTRLKEQQVDLIVLLAHDAQGRDWNHYAALGVDVVLAHWSQFYPPDKEALTTSTGMIISYTRGVRKGGNAAHLKVEFKQKEKPVALFEEEIDFNTRNVKPDKDVGTLAGKEARRVNEKLDEIIGKVSGNRSIAHSLGSYSPAGQLVLEALRDATGAEIIIYNSPGIRAGLSKGAITYADLVNMLPFGNRIVMFELKGKDLLEFAGLRNANVLALGLEFGTEVKINGRPVAAAKTYTIASNDYLVERGSGPFEILKRGENKMYVGNDLEALRAYVKKNSPLTINPKTRIVKGRRRSRYQ